MKLGRVFVAAFGLSLLASSAWAFRPSAELAEHQGLRAADGRALRTNPQTSWTAPKEHEAWSRFVAVQGPAWRSLWDLDRVVPSRVFGSGIEAKGAIESAEAAEKHARRILEQHLDLFAPGTRAKDFELSANQLDAGIRTVAFVQRHRGLEVQGGQLSVRFKNDRLFVIASEAWPRVEVQVDETLVDPAIAEQIALDWIRSDLGSTVEIRSSRGPFILPMVFADGAIAYRHVIEVVVDAKDPIGRWSVYLEAGSGLPVARAQTLMFAAGSLAYNTPERHPRSTRNDAVASGVTLSVNGAQVTTAADGSFTWQGASAAQVTAGVRGPLVRVLSDSGAEASVDFTLQDGAQFVWNLSSSEREDAQLTTYVSSQVVKAYTKAIAPTMTYLDAQLQANVNLNDVCNAFSDGETINFFVAGGGCENTGRLPDVIYHEFGHAFHANAIIRGAGSFDTSLSEGASDYLAATMVNDSGMGRGFFGNDQALRELDPSGTENVWPRDTGEPHYTGIIFGGAMWDLRELLIQRMGQQDGVTHTDFLWYQALRRSADIPSSYVEVIAADDDDGDLANGTPHICEINDAFARHGLAELGDIGPSIGQLQRDGFDLSIAVGKDSICPGSDVQGALVEWRLRSNPSQGGVITMAGTQDGFEASIPPQRDGEVIEYRVELSLSSGDNYRLPRNPASPFYEAYIGPVTELYCTDFESDPEAGGWSHSLVSGTNQEGADDWQWGVPAGTAGSGDPGRANSGTRVIGNDLGGGNFNGLYQSSKVNEMRSPAIDTQEFETVRLQYRRWLNVEDASYDRAVILSNGQEVWNNLATQDGGLHHEDKEWRFQDVDLSGTIQNGTVQVGFRIESDRGLEFGGWTIDDFCIVGVGQSAPTPRCGDGILDAGEACDDGNNTSGDGCSAECAGEQAQAICGDGVVQAGEICDDGNDVAGDGCDQCATEPGATCGNGIVEGAEACDDGNRVDDDACRNACVPSGPSSSCLGPDCDVDPNLQTIDDKGCGCSAADPGARPSAWWLSLLGVVLISRRRRSAFRQ